MIKIPELALVALVGASGSGKSTFARRHFRPTQVLSSDAFRAMVSDDEDDQSATGAAFDILYRVAAARLRAGRLTVVDATNVQPHARAEVLRVAREHDVLPVAIVLDVPESVCWERTRARTDRRIGRPAISRQHRDLRASLKRLGREGFRYVYVLRGVDEIDAAQVTFTKLYTDRTELTGPFDIIGDVHGCREELAQLLTRLGWRLRHDPDGTLVDAAHPEGRTAVFVGDLVDRGPDSPGVLRLVMNMVEAGTALCVAGNHEQKLLRALRGRKVQTGHGLAQTLSQLAEQPPEFTERVVKFLDGLISHYVLDGGALVVAHAGLKEEYHGRSSGRVRAFALYGDTTGERDEYGLPVRYPWARDYRGKAMVVYGHTPMVETEWVNNTICVDTGCVFGGKLTALRYPERELVSVPAAREYAQSARPLPASPASDPPPAAHPAPTSDPAPTWGAAPPAEPSQSSDPTPASASAPGPDRAGGREGVNLAEVTGRRRIDTGYGAVTISAEHAAAALEVMSRFAVDPRWLVWLPPTMAPCSTSDEDGYLEHPARAFADYRAAGVGRVVCQEKHMGSRAVVLVCRDPAVAAQRFDLTGGGVVYTRTGRPFFPDDRLHQTLLDRVRDTIDHAGLWAKLDTDWLLLDTELLPWSARAEELIRDGYAGVGAAARAALPAAQTAVRAAAARGLDLADLPERLSRRLANVTAFTEAYRAYVRPTDGLTGVSLAPFAVLASEGASHAGRDHEWHLGLADRLVDAARQAGYDGLFTPTRRRVVDLADEAAVAAATRWWHELTAAGGEGMVVKPYDGLAVTRGRSLVQPGIKCRGREYLRLIYGPDYLDPEQLAGLRRRSLGRKRGLALREHALGLAALDGLAQRAPLWRRHQLVFAILACESEPVDPRL